MPPIVADPVISFLRERAHTQEYAHQANYRYPSHGPSELLSMGKEDVMQRLDIITNEMAAAGRIGRVGAKQRRAACTPRPGVQKQAKGTRCLRARKPWRRPRFGIGS